MGLIDAARRAEDWIEKLRLQPHPEGGFYRVTYSAGLMLAKDALPPAFRGSRPACTAIYFLLQAGNFSAFHRIRSDELWHFYAGDPLLVHVLDDCGGYSRIELGVDLDAGQVFQANVPGGRWFASELQLGGSFALVGCTVAPGFDFEDFELGQREELIRTFPQHRELIQRLTRS